MLCVCACACACACAGACAWPTHTVLAVIVQLLAIPNHELVNYVLGALVNIASDSSLRDGMKKSKAVEM